LPDIRKVAGVATESGGPQAMFKDKFKSLNFDSVEVLSKEEQKKLKGGYPGSSYKPKGIWYCNGAPLHNFSSYSACNDYCSKAHSGAPGGTSTCSYA
jgi:hypothetical protein